MADENRGGSEKKGKKSKKKLIIVAAGVLLLTLSGGVLWKTGLAMKFIGDRLGEKESASASGGPDKEMGPTYALGTFIVNLNDAAGRRYLKLKAELELADEKVTEAVDKRLPQLRDSIILLLSSKSFQEISSMEGKMRLRQEMLGQLSNYLGKGKLNTIYFTEFVVQ